MGLDISVLKPIKPTEELIRQVLEDKIDEVYSITNNPVLEKWKNLSFKKEEEYIDFEKTFAELDLNHKDYEWFMTDNKGYHFTKINYPDNPALIIKHSELQTYKVLEDVIICEEVGYQRKGANSLFYEEDIWGHPPIVDLDTLTAHWEKYFSYKTPESNGGFGSGVEYVQEDEVMRANFKENIIDKFIEGETFVDYC